MQQSIFCSVLFIYGNIIHVSNSIAAYVQEIGRAGRDGKPSEAVIFVNRNDLAANVQHLSEDMRAYCTTDLCRRKLLLSYFGFEKEPVSSPHLCCDRCKEGCNCKECQDMTEITEAMAASFEPEVKPSKEGVQYVDSMLNDYFTAENSIAGCPLSSAVTGLCPETAAEIAAKYTEYQSMHTLQSTYSNLKQSYLENIHKIIVYICDKYHS